MQHEMMDPKRALALHVEQFHAISHCNRAKVRKDCNRARVRKDFGEEDRESPDCDSSKESPEEEDHDNEGAPSPYVTDNEAAGTGNDDYLQPEPARDDPSVLSTKSPQLKEIP